MTSPVRLRVVQPISGSPVRGGPAATCTGQGRTFGRTDSDTLNGASRPEHSLSMTATTSASQAPSLPPTPSTAPTARELLAKHRRWMKLRKRYADGTILKRMSDVELFLRWCEARGYDPLDLSFDEVDEWQEGLGDRVSATTHRNHTSQVRQFYRWLVREEYIDRDPTVRIDLPKIPRRRPRVISEGLLQRAMHLADDAYMRAIILLAGFAGLRAAEIARLAWPDVDLESGRLLVTGKGGHERVVDIADSPLLLAALHALPHKSGPVIRKFNGRSGHYSANSLDRQANNFLHQVVGCAETLHQLRHRFASKAYQECQDPITVARLLGHGDLSTVMNYAEGTSEMARAAVAAAGRIHTPGLRSVS